MLTDYGAKPPGREPPERTPETGARRIVRYSRVAILIAAIYVVVVLFMRWYRDRQYEARLKREEKAQQRVEDERSLETMGGSTFAIEGFYAMPGELARGQSADLCYSVANAQSVKIDPDTNRPVWPSLNRCIKISPQKTTTYTLTARDAHGAVRRATLTIEVR